MWRNSHKRNNLWRKTDMAEKVIEQKPLEYWIARSTDPFISDTERNQFLDNLCEQINHEADGAYVSMKILGHKILSPDQSEALNTLKAVDTCVRRCGPRVHNEIAKFRFLNQFVRLLSPKYNGETTSADVRAQAVKMLYIWQKTMRYLPKLKQVYDLLKDQRVLEDPQLSFEPECVTPPSKLATFEDEEKANLLSQLLKSNNKEDLQAANRLIKSMVRSEDQKVERLNKRTTDIEKTKSACRLLDEVLTYCSDELNSHESEIAQELFTTLIELRPQMFRYAGEAAENNDAALADILAVNDSVNRVISRYKKLCDGKEDAERTEELVSLDCRASRNDIDANLLSSGDGSGSPSPYDLLCHIPEPVKENMKEDKKPMDTEKTDVTKEEAALIVMGPESEEQPTVTSVCNGDKGHSALSDLSVLITSLPASENTESATKVIVENEVDKMEIFERDNVKALEDSMPYSLKSITVSLDQLQLSSHIPLTMFDKKGIKGMLCFAENPLPSIRRLIVTVASVTSSHTRPVHNVKLSLSCKNQDIETRLFSVERDSFPAFSPISALPTITQIFLILPHGNNFNSIDIDYILLFSAPLPDVISGTFPLHF